MRERDGGGFESGFSEFGLCLDWKRRPQRWALRRIMEKRERRKGGLWLCVYPHRWSAHTDGSGGGGGLLCVKMCVCVCSRGVAELCPPVGTKVTACVLKACMLKDTCVYLCRCWHKRMCALACKNQRRET